MANKDYNFQYTPLTGRLPGNSFVKQTEQAINELAGIVNEGAAQVEVITNLANQANDNSEVALEKATEALETSGRVYITLPNLEDADDYFDSQLYYFANSYSHNLPVQDTGFLEVKTNDTKTACEQEFVADLTGLSYFRHGTITSTEVGSETVYSVTWGTWSGELASEDYVQQEIATAISAANGYTDEKVAGYLPLSGGTITGTIISETAYVLKRSVDDSSLILYGGTAYNRGAHLNLSGKDSSYASHFNLIAHDGTRSGILDGSPDGTLTWNGKNVERVNASGTNYIRFESGLQICWNFENLSASKTYTFPIPFVSFAPVVVSGTNTNTITTSVNSLSTTGFEAHMSNYNNFAYRWIAIGYWK